MRRYSCEWCRDRGESVNILRQVSTRAPPQHRAPQQTSLSAKCVFLRFKRISEDWSPVLVSVFTFYFHILFSQGCVPFLSPLPSPRRQFPEELGQSWRDLISGKLIFETLVSTTQNTQMSQKLSYLVSCHISSYLESSHLLVAEKLSYIAISGTVISAIGWLWPFLSAAINSPLRER